MKHWWLTDLGLGKILYLALRVFFADIIICICIQRFMYLCFAFQYNTYFLILLFNSQLVFYSQGLTVLVSIKAVENYVFVYLTVCCDVYFPLVINQCIIALVWNIMFDFQGALSTGADQNASGSWINPQPIRATKGDIVPRAGWCLNDQIGIDSVHSDTMQVDDDIFCCF